MVAAVALGVVISVVLVGLRHGSPSFPAEVGGLERVDDGQTDAASKAFRSMADAQGLDADLAFYASAGTPTVALMRVDTGGAAAGDAAIESFLDGFASGFAGGAIDGQAIVRSSDGVTFRCAPVSGQVEAGVCLWDEGGVVWVLVDARAPSSLEASRQLAASVHDALA